MRKNEELICLARKCWKNMMENEPNLVIPLINEMLDCNIPSKEKVKIQSRPENVLEESEGLCVDIVDLFIADKKYEMVCVCSIDGIMLLSCMDRVKKTPQNVYGHIAHFMLLEDADVWSLDANANNVRIKAKGIMDYSSNEIVNKKLWFLIPLVLLNFAKDKELVHKYYFYRADISKIMMHLLTALMVEVRGGNLDETTSKVVLAQCNSILDFLNN